MNKQDRFDKFTERARKVLSLAQEEAQRLMHSSIGTEHLLPGLMREGQGVAAHVLTHMGADLQGLRKATTQIIAQGSVSVLGEIGFSLEAKEAIHAALDEAQRMNHHYVGTEHLLLGLARNAECKAHRILQRPDRFACPDDPGNLSVRKLRHSQAYRQNDNAARGGNGTQ